MELSLEELARTAGEPLEQVREWHAAGVLGTTSRFTERDVERVRLVSLLRRRGVPLEQVAAHRADIDGFVERATFLPTGAVRPLADAAAEVGIDPDVAERIWVAAGLVPSRFLDDRDVEFLRFWQVLRRFGHPDDAAIEIARVIGDSVRRATEAMARITHFRVFNRFFERGLTGKELRDAIGEVVRHLVPIGPPMVEHLTRHLLAEASRENFALRFVGEGTGTGQLVVGIAFVDLCSFTPIADAMGDAESADVLTRFSALVREASLRHDGRVVKQIGDAFMLMFAHPRAAVACMLDVERRAADEPRFPALRAGINWGPVLYRDGDYVGANVNVAARVTDEAGRHELLVTDAVRRAAAPMPGVEFHPVARRRLKGVSEDVELFRVVAAETGAGARLVDPVCGMEVGAAEAAARLAVGGREVVFCSAQCLQRYVADPRRYADPTSGRPRDRD